MTSPASPAEDLQRFQDIVQMSKSSGWADVKALIDGWVSESHEAMLGCMAGMEVRGMLSFRYQQRLCLKREIENFIESAQTGLDQIVEEMRRELDEQHTDSTASYAGG